MLGPAGNHLKFLGNFQDRNWIDKLEIKLNVG